MEKIVKINNDEWYFFEDYFSKKVKFHKLPKGTIIPIANANAPSFDGTIQEAMVYVKKMENGCIAKNLQFYKYKYERLTEGKSADFKINFLTGALATTNNRRIRVWLEKEQNKQRGIHFRK